jgi:N-acetylglucosamine-6-phosphate deacetylase
VTTLVTAPRLFVGGRLAGPGVVALEGDRIHSVSTAPVATGPAPGANGAHALDGVATRNGAIEEIALPDGVLTPGLVDLQINGAFGVDFADARAGDWRTIRAALLRSGVTAFAPTLITATLPRLADSLVAIDAAAAEQVHGSRILGAHVEGPFLSPDYHGAHDPSLMRDPTPEALDLLLGGPTPAIVTLAPERRHALDAIARLTAAGVLVSVGHTAATAAQVHAAADTGARMVTHVFNAQRRLGHREPGTAGAALTDPRLTVGMIADLQHIAGEIVALIFRAAAGGVVLVTDAVAAMGITQDRTVLGGSDVYLDDEGLPRRADGTIAGSVLTLDQAVRNAIACGVDPATVLDAVTRTPADLVGRPDLGRLAPGAHADLIWWSDDWEVRNVWVGGVPLTNAFGLASRSA